MNGIILSLTLTLSMWTSLAAAAPVTLDKAKGKTEFLAVVKPSGIRINGRGVGPEGTLDLKKDGANFLLSGSVEMDVASFDTGMSLRNNHMKEKYLEVEKFPKATLVINDVKVTKEMLASGGDLKFPATLKLHGVDKPVDVSMNLANDGDMVKAVSKFKVKISEFNIEKPTFSGITVSDEVEVSTEAQFKKSELSVM